MNQEKIGKFIAEKRRDANITQEELAKKLGITKNAVSKWERGICLMDMSLLKPLSEELHVSINEILAGEMISDKDVREVADKNILEFDKLNKIMKTKLPFCVSMFDIFMITILYAILSFSIEFEVNLPNINYGFYALIFGVITLYASFGYHMISTIIKKDKLTLILTIILCICTVVPFILYIVDFFINV